MVYCMCRLVSYNCNDRRLRTTNPLILDLRVPPHKRSKYIFRRYFFTGNISFHVLDILKLNKKLVWVSSVGRGRGGGVAR